MDYEKKYKEALERAKTILKTEDGLVRVDNVLLADIFPELGESEDERVIKRIKTAVEQYWSDEPLDEILAWLEKQNTVKWRPTDKQLDALHNAVFNHTWASSEMANYATELYYQLEELKETGE